MTALPVIRLPAAEDVSSPVADEPVALLQLDLADPVEAASAVYSQVWRGRRVVAVACGRADASVPLAEALDAIGVTTVRAAPGEALLHDGVMTVPGWEVAASRHWSVRYADPGAS